VTSPIASCMIWAHSFAAPHLTTHACSLSLGLCTQHNCDLPHMAGRATSIWVVWPTRPFTGPRANTRPVAGWSRHYIRRTQCAPSSFSYCSCERAIDAVQPPGQALSQSSVLICQALQPLSLLSGAPVERAKLQRSALAGHLLATHPPSCVLCACLAGPSECARRRMNTSQPDDRIGWLAVLGPGQRCSAAVRLTDGQLVP